MKNVYGLPLVLACLMGASSLSPAAASADTLGPFIDYLDSNGVDVSTIDAQNADVELGKAICGMYPPALRVGANPNDGVMAALRPRHTEAEAAMWLVGSVNYVCPQYVYLLP
ncbi:MAG TPA: DUF732 domain-containing protein [Mycobacterium sp.]|jgi:hypothetical protein|nr:DUF732 domain-containing protein [Mycobacterium sp.]